MAVDMHKRGSVDFRNFIENGEQYVDKTDIIKELISKNNQSYLITRPRRFGKTLTMNMLAEFFDVSKDSKKLFSNLKIAQYKELCNQWMNKYPVIFISFAEAICSSKDEFISSLKEILRTVYNKHSYLRNSDKLNSVKLDYFNSIDKYIDNNEYSFVIKHIISCLRSHWENKVIVLIDEYDTPFNNSYTHNTYNEIKDIFRKILKSITKDNNDIAFTIMTGCLRIGKDSSYTGLNNTICYGIDDESFADKFGFTEYEVKNLLHYNNISEMYSVVKECYDGYLFGNGIEIYNPWDIMNYISNFKTDNIKNPRYYWLNTSENELIKLLLDTKSKSFDYSYNTLMNNESIAIEINDDITYSDIKVHDESLWTLLYFTGYLTKCGSSNDSDLNNINTTQLNKKYINVKIPNKEIYYIFENYYGKFLNRTTSDTDRQQIYSSLWNCDSESLSKQISDIIFQGISFHDYKEYTYHYFLFGLFTEGAIRECYSNAESGLGLPDLVLVDNDMGQIAVIEIKVANSEKELDKMANTALKQIVDKKYDIAPRVPKGGNFPVTVRCGIAFHKKMCRVKCEKIPLF